MKITKRREKLADLVGKAHNRFLIGMSLVHSHPKVSISKEHLGDYSIFYFGLDSLAFMDVYHNLREKFQKLRKELPNSVHGIRHLEQCAISNEFEGKGRRCVEMIPRIAGIPRSNANWT